MLKKLELWFLLCSSFLNVILKEVHSVNGNEVQAFKGGTPPHSLKIFKLQNNTKLAGQFEAMIH